MVRKADGIQQSHPTNGNDLVETAVARLNRGLSPPREIYLVQNRNRIPWTELPAWARPSDPELFDGCCHEG